MNNPKWRIFIKFSGVTLVLCFLIAFSAYGADTTTLDRLDKIIQQHQAQIEAQPKGLEQLQEQVDTNALGKFSMGWGSTASDGTSEMDLSGTSVVGYSSVGDMAGGQLFFNDNTDSLSDTDIGDIFSNMDGLGRDERIRYDTTNLNGFIGSASYIADGGGDIAVRYNGEIEAFIKVAAAIAYSNPGSSSDVIDDQLNGSVSVLFNSGLNGTVAMGSRDNKSDSRDDAEFFYTKIGYQADWCPIGVTSLAVDYGNYSDIRKNGDQADTFGFQMVQDFKKWAAETYLGYRFHKLDSNDGEYENINAIMTGMRIKF